MLNITLKILDFAHSERISFAYSIELVYLLLLDLFFSRVMENIFLKFCSVKGTIPFSSTFGINFIA